MVRPLVELKIPFNAVVSSPAHTVFPRVIPLSFFVIKRNENQTEKKERKREKRGSLQEESKLDTALLKWNV